MGRKLDETIANVMLRACVRILNITDQMLAASRALDYDADAHAIHDLAETGKAAVEAGSVRDSDIPMARTARGVGEMMRRLDAIAERAQGATKDEARLRALAEIRNEAQVCRNDIAEWREASGE